MRIGFIGDIVGRPGRKIIKENLIKIKAEFNIDFIIANGENSVASVLHVTTNEMSSMLNEFSNQIMNGVELI